MDASGIPSHRTAQGMVTTPCLFKYKGAGLAERSWAQKLREQGKLLGEGNPSHFEVALLIQIEECPLSLLELLLPRCFEHESANILFLEMEKNLVRLDCGFYAVENVLEQENLFEKHVELLRRLPDSSLKVINIIVLGCQRYCEQAIDRHTWRRANEAIPEICSYFDEMLLRFVETIFLVQNKGCPYHKLIPLIDRILTHRNLHGFRLWSVLWQHEIAAKLSSQFNVSFDDPAPIGNYRKSKLFLARWHVNTTSILVTQKVAGHVLPVELVKLICESWVQDVDKQLDVVS